METQRAQWQVTRSRRIALSIRQKRAELNITSTPSRLYIDQTESFASAGLKTPLRLAGDFYNNSLAAGLDAISSITQEGLRFLRIEDGGNPIREIARTRGQRTRQLSIQAMPQVAPHITFEPGQHNIDWEPHSISTDWEVIEGQADFVPHRVSIYINPYPSIEISVTDETEIKNPEKEWIGM